MSEQQQMVEVLTPSELAQRLKCSARTIHRAAQSGLIEGWRSIRVGGRRRFIHDTEARARE